MGHETTVVCDAILFDLDGVLVDSHPLIERILREWAAARGVDPDKAVAASYGRRDVDLIRVVAPELDAEAEAGWIIGREEKDFDGLAPVPGAAGLLTALPVTAWAIVTSGTRAVATGRLRAAGLPRPAHMVTADDVREGKPAPEGYLRGAALLGVAPGRCLVVEDARAGVEAARAAGMRTLGVGDALRDADLDAWAPDLRPVSVTAADAGLAVVVAGTGPDESAVPGGTGATPGAPVTSISREHSGSNRREVGKGTV